MCSVGWQWASDCAPSEPQLTILFNRDEQRARELAIPPTEFENSERRVLMPIDPARGGTWIATNELGLTIALLNNYGIEPVPERVYESRGRLVKEASSAETLTEVENILKALLAQGMYPAFSLLAWMSASRSVRLFAWNEEELVEPESQSNFFTSSSWKTKEVQRHRRALYQQEVLEKGRLLEDFMSQPSGDDEKWSVMMTREKTQTVSRSKIEVFAGYTRFKYTDRATGVESLRDLKTSVE